MTHAGTIYVTESNDASPYSGKVWLIRPHGEKTVVAEGLNGPTGISLSPDGLWLCAAESKGHHGYSYRVQPSGELQLGEPYYWFHVPDTANDSGVTQVCMDRDGYAYAATRMGVQIFDRNGRVRAILPVGRSSVGWNLFWRRRYADALRLYRKRNLSPQAQVGGRSAICRAHRASRSVRGIKRFADLVTSILRKLVRNSTNDALIRRSRFGRI